MRIRMLVATGPYRRGHIVPDCHDGQARIWIQRGFAVEEKLPESIETAAIEHQAETADATPRKRGRRAVQKPDANDAARR